MTTFEQDGYRDAMKGSGYHPPSHPKTNVYEMEYKRGYDLGYLYSGRAAGDYMLARAGFPHRSETL